VPSIRMFLSIFDPIKIENLTRIISMHSNGKVEGMGITHPSGKGQESVVRMAYEKAGLNPNATAYAELHGTGTPVGDPIEARAIASAMNDSRSPEKPLLLGAVCFPQPAVGSDKCVHNGLELTSHNKHRSNPILATARPPVEFSPL